MRKYNVPPRFFSRRSSDDAFSPSSSSALHERSAQPHGTSEIDSPQVQVIARVSAKSGSFHPKGRPERQHLSTF